MYADVHQKKKFEKSHENASGYLEMTQQHVVEVIGLSKVTSVNISIESTQFARHPCRCMRPESDGSLLAC